ncbi:MAG: hypothetical protein J6B67_00115 [Oscillospiraceae bacterium]|nr:hypothetical protein [Oscillospiraceae bacterium]
MAHTAVKEKPAVPAQAPRKRISLFRKIKTVYVMDGLLGQRFSRLGRLVRNLIYIILGSIILHLLIRSCQPVPVVTDGETVIQAAGAQDILGALLNVVTVVVTCFTAIQVHMMRDINHMEMSHYIFDDNQTFRRDMHKAHQELVRLAKCLSYDTDFDNTYLLEDWENLRAFAYHHEYMGYLVFRDRLNFDIVFDTVAFPNWLINSDEAKKVIAAGREHTPDFWNGATHLYLSYEIRRKYNKRLALRQDWKSFSAAERRKARKAVDKTAVLESTDELPSVRSLYTAENVLQNLLVTERDYKNACKAWKEQYVTLPE